MTRNLRFPILAAALLALVAFPAFAQDEAAVELPNVDEVVAAHLENIGGADKWAAVQSVKLSGKLSMPQGMEADFVMKQKRPGKVRIEFTLQGMTGIQAYDGETGWQIMPFMGSTDPEKMPAEQVDEFKDQAEIDPVLYNWKERGYTVEVVGMDEVEGSEAIKLKVVRNGKEEMHFLDSEYYLTLKQTGEREMMGNQVQYELTFSDFKEVDGMMMPHSMTQGAVGIPMTQTVRIDTVEINSDIPDDEFAMPATEPAVAAEE